MKKLISLFLLLFAISCEPAKYETKPMNEGVTSAYNFGGYYWKIVEIEGHRYITSGNYIYHLESCPCKNKVEPFSYY